MPEEPSILDYLKSKLPWHRGQPLEIPPASQPETGAPPPEAAEPQVAPPGRRFPWRTLLALFLAFVGQRSMEPPRLDPGAAALLGGFFYLAAIGVAWMAWLRNEWTLAPLPPTERRDDPLTVRWVPVAISTVLLLAAFLLFTNNLFTLLNVTLWVAGIILFVYGFWLPNPQAEPVLRRLRRFFSQPSWRIIVTRWTVLVLLVGAVVVFYRVYRLAEVPNEPFSDHAEKLLDVGDVLAGQTHIFFPRNTGREFFQMYLTVVVIKLFHTGLTFLSLKIGTVAAGLFALPFIYLLGKEMANRRVGLIALAFAGIAYWPNVISRIGLRFPLYPLFAAPVLYFLIRGLRRSSRNDFILAGLFLGLGLNGYSAYRFMPFVVVAAFILYFLHRQSKGMRRQGLYWLALLVLASFIIFLPLLHYALEFPADVAYRALTRLTGAETPIPGPVWQVFLSNLWRGMGMFTWDDGEIWVHSVPYRPALDIISAGLFILGCALVFARYVRERNWFDIFLLVSVPLMLMPSILSLAFPHENPSLNRTSGAIVPVFLIVGYSLDGAMSAIEKAVSRPRRGALAAWGLAAVLFLFSARQNYDLVFNQFISQYRTGTWNTSEIGGVVGQFARTVGSPDQAWVIPYPYWVDTRLVGVGAGYGPRDFALARQNIGETVSMPGPKLYVAKYEDEQTLSLLEHLYPQGALSRYTSAVPGQDFWIFFVPAGK